MKRIASNENRRGQRVFGRTGGSRTKPQKGEVLVEMLAIPIHPADLLVMRGRHVFTATYPCGTGIEGAGRVIAHGEGVSHPPIGSRVALPFGGTWAEKVTIPANSVIPLPEEVDLYQGAMIALNPVTALGLLMGMKSGEWLIHNAANSSSGSSHHKSGQAQRDSQHLGGSSSWNGR